MFHLGFRHGLEHAVAPEAPAERRDGPEEVELPQDLDDLAPAVGLPHQVAMGDLGPLQEAAIPGQESPLVVRRDRSQLVVGAVVPPYGIESEEAQGPGEPPEVDVEHESRLAQRPWVQPHEWRHVGHLGHGVHVHAVALTHLVPEAHGDSVDEDHVDLRVRHPKRLGEILHRGAGGHLESDRPLAPIRRLELVQLGEEADVDAVDHRGGA